jgi:hypothetical protein
MRTISAGKKTIIGAKVNKDEKDRLLARCDSLKCTITDYLKQLIDRDFSRVENRQVTFSVSENTVTVPCWNCGWPVTFNLDELGLRIYRG